MLGIASQQKEGILSRQGVFHGSDLLMFPVRAGLIRRQNPKWYDRDRPLFKKYLPLIKRVAQAGWEPVTDAGCDNPHIFVERFGFPGGKALFLTLFNDTETTQKGVLRLHAAAFGREAPFKARELIADTPMQGADRWEIELQAQGAKLIQLVP